MLDESLMLYLVGDLVDAERETANRVSPGVSDSWTWRYPPLQAMTYLESEKHPSPGSKYWVLANLSPGKILVLVVTKSFLSFSFLVNIILLFNI